MAAALQIHGTPLALLHRMRIQETDRILKDSRVARHGHGQHEHEHNGNVISRAWQKIVGVFKR
ncbi:MAG TPA: hypothetical protein VI670_17325 [Thermoanaerobaculia bacterium]|jgi:hypothetical protein